MPRNGEWPHKEKKRNVSAAFALEKLATGTLVQRSATEFIESGRPDPKRVFLCAVCREPMHWNAGITKKGNQQTTSGALARSAPHFDHNPGTLQKHIETETSEIAIDLVQFLARCAQDERYDVEITEGNKNAAWIVTITNNKGHEPITASFVISPTPTQTTKQHPDAIILTTPTGQAADSRRMLLFDPHGNPLTPQLFRDYITANKLDNIRVSGFYERINRDEPIRRAKFQGRHISLRSAIRGIMTGQMHFIAGVNTVPHDIFPSGAAFAAVATRDLEAAQLLVSLQKPKIKRDEAPALIATALGLSVLKDTRRIPRTNRYRWGLGSKLYAFRGYVRNPKGLWYEGDHTLLINPSHAQMAIAMRGKDMDKTLVVLVPPDNINRRRYEGLRARRKRFREQNPECNFDVVLCDDIDAAIAVSEKHLRLELQLRDEWMRTEEANELGTPLLPVAPAGTSPNVPGARAAGKPTVRVTSAIAL